MKLFSDLTPDEKIKLFDRLFEAGVLVWRPDLERFHEGKFDKRTCIVRGDTKDLVVE